MPRDENETDLMEIDEQEPVEQTAEVVTPKDKAADATESETLKETRLALKAVRATLRETNETAKFWMEQARNGGGPAKAKEEPKPTTSVDLVEAITSGDTAAIAKAMGEMGFARHADIANALGASRGQQTQDQQLYDRFPELADEKSDFFLETAEIYNDLARRDPVLAKSGLLSEVAAELADKRLGGAKPTARTRTVDRDAEDDDPDEDLTPAERREAARVARVGRQAGDRGRRSSRADDQPGSDALDKTQKTIVAKLRAAGADITEDGYRKRATAGVRMSGMPTRRARY